MYVHLSSESDEESTSSIKKEPKSTSETEEESDMANAGDDDPEIGWLTAHLDGEPAQAIVSTQRQRAIDNQN